MKENDLLFGAFADRHLATMSDEHVAWLEALLMDNDDIDLNNWLVGRNKVPPELDHPVMKMLLSFKYAS
jgi:antitoxin CptB